MKKMKRFIALPIACIAAFSLVACDKDAAPHSHSYASEWSKNDTMHWHAATCQCEDVYGDVAGHTDEDHDGDCDVCGWFDENHTHTYKSDWTFDESGHWKESTCYHNVKGEFAEHTPDNIGNCSVCGYDVADPVIGSISAAIELAETQKSNVKEGVIVLKDDYSTTTTSYEFRDGYVFVNDSTGDTYYFSYGTDEVKYLGIKVDNYGDESAVAATENHLNGPQINSFYGTEDTVSFGVENLVKDLYAMAQLNANDDFVTNVDAENNTYSFSFGNQVMVWGSMELWTVEVAFTLDDETYAMDTVEVTAKQYYDITETDGVYTINDGATANQTKVFTAKQDKDLVLENPYTPEAILVQNFKITDYDGEEQTSVTVELGEESSALYLDKALTPETAILGTAEITFSGTNIEHGLSTTLNTTGLLVRYNVGDSYFYVEGLKAGDYELTVTVNGISKTLNVSVVIPDPTLITVGTQGEYRGNTTVEAATSATITTTDTFKLIVALDQGEGVTLTCDDTDVTVGAPVKSTLYEKGYYNEWWDEYELEERVGYTYSFSGLAEGTYTFTATSTQVSDLTATFTLTVETAQQGGGDDTTTGGSVSVDVTNVSQIDRTTLDVDLPAGTYAITASNVSDDAVSNDVYITIYVNNESVAVLKGENDFTAENIEILAGATIEVGQDLYDNQDFTVTFTSPALAGSSDEVITLTGTGVQTDPYIITESGDYVASSVSGSYIYYKWEATTAGTVTIAFDGNDWNGGWGTFNFDLVDNFYNPTNTKTVAVGDTLYIKINAYGEATADVPFTLTLPTASESGDDTTDDDTTVATSGTFTVTDTSGATALDGTYSYSIADGVITVMKDGVETTDILFTTEFGSGYYQLQTMALRMPAYLVDASGNYVTELSGTLYVMGESDVMYTLVFSA